MEPELEQEAKGHLGKIRESVNKIPTWRLWLYVALFAMGCGYLAWSKWGPKPPPPGAVVTLPVAPAIANMPTKQVVIRTVVVKGKAKAVEKLKLPAIESINPLEELQTANEIPAAKYGATTAVFVNRSSGQSRVVVKTNEAPWFRLERGNRVGIEAGVGNGGYYQHADYQRDVFSIKGVVFAGKASVTHDEKDTDARVGVRVEYNW